jgi:hypothetical protein
MLIILYGILKLVMHQKWNMYEDNIFNPLKNVNMIETLSSIPLNVVCIVHIFVPG